MDKLLIVTIVVSLLSLISMLCGLIANLVLTRKKLKEQNKEVAKMTEKLLSQIHLQMNRASVFNYESDSILGVVNIEQIKNDGAICNVRSSGNKKIKYYSYEINSDKSKEKSIGTTDNSIKPFARYNNEKGVSISIMSEEKSNQRSVLIMKNLYFEKISFERDENIPHELQTNFNTDIKTNGNEVKVKLFCSVRSDAKVYIDITLVGIFENNEENEKLREDINTINTVAIMFPYLRTEMSLVTAQPNFPTIDLPIVNITELINKKVEITAKLSN